MVMLAPWQKLLAELSWEVAMNTSLNFTDSVVMLKSIFYLH